MTNIQIEIVSFARCGSGKNAFIIFECIEREGDKEIGYKYIYVKSLQDLGVIKTAAATQAKKAEAWLNSGPGIIYYKAAPHSKLPI